MIDALIFDFDGLIVDTETTDYLSWRETFATLGCELPFDLWTANIGSTYFDPYVYLESQLGPLDRQMILAQRKQREDELVAALPVLPGVEACLAQARELGLKVGLASSSSHRWVDTHLQRLGLFEQFEVICCRDDVDGRSKPDPAVYIAACSRLNVPPECALALEDSVNGAWAAKRAGLWCAVIPGQMTHSLNFAHADYRLTSLAEMPLDALISRILQPKSNAERIRQFHQAVDASPPAHPVVPAPEVLQLRRRLIEEEYEEVTAVFDRLLDPRAAAGVSTVPQLARSGDQPEQLDSTSELAPLIHELADLLYVTYGAIVACGVDPDAVFAEVHRANLLKAGGPRREDGKILKPPDWQPADVKRVIERQQTA